MRAPGVASGGALSPGPPPSRERCAFARRERWERRRKPARLTVIKLGGSHALDGILRDWLVAITGQAGPIVIVPGGGPFADAVRAAQAPMKFDDAAAHEMALLAMAQFGRALCSLHPALALADSRAAIKRLLAEKKVPVWAPARMALAAGLPASWELTADSLAAWLAGELGADRLVLVKHGDFGAVEDAGELVRRGIVDPLFPEYLRRSGVPASIAAPQDHSRLAEELRRPALTRIAYGVDAPDKSAKTEA